MSVYSRIFIGYTVTIKKDLCHEDFKKCEEFVHTHPELDEYHWKQEELEGKLLLIRDGMDGDFLRLVLVDKFKDHSSVGSGNEFFELRKPIMNLKDYEKMQEVYKAYTGEKLDLEDIKYAMWSQWY